MWEFALELPSREAGVTLQSSAAEDRNEASRRIERMSKEAARCIQKQIFDGFKKRDV
jgi:hypothetical protein